MLRELKLFAVSQYSKARRRLIGENAVGILYESENGLILTEPGDYAIGKSLAVEGAFGSDILLEVDNLGLKEAAVCIVGAHVGTLVIPVARNARHVSAYEANPKTFKLLQMNLLLNGIENVTARNLAASDSFGKLDFYCNSVNSGGSKRKPLKDRYIYNYDHPSLIQVDAYPLDEIDDNVYDLIIMDIEGSEYFALKGMQRILSNARAMIIEYLPHHLDNVAGVSDKEFLSVFSIFFDSVKIIGKNEVYKKNEFLLPLESLRESSGGSDLLFFKDDPR